ncbi:hypothetical protein LTR94_025797 [Friedmanniomyces endolithicus]|nr:hypothetical protein LTR94_025797 [Friedmanniomyces endolithicus]
MRRNDPRKAQAGKHDERADSQGSQSGAHNEVGRQREQGERPDKPEGGSRVSDIGENVDISRLIPEDDTDQNFNDRPDRKYINQAHDPFGQLHVKSAGHVLSAKQSGDEEKEGDRNRREQFDEEPDLPIDNHGLGDRRGDVEEDDRDDRKSAPDVHPASTKRRCHYSPSQSLFVLSRSKRRRSCIPQLSERRYAEQAERSSGLLAKALGSTKTTSTKEHQASLEVSKIDPVMSGEWLRKSFSNTEHTGASISIAKRDDTLIKPLQSSPCDKQKSKFPGQFMMSFVSFLLDARRRAISMRNRQTLRCRGISRAAMASNESLSKRAFTADQMRSRT